MTDRRTNCPDNDRLLAFVLDEADDLRRAGAVARHLGRCARCRKRATDHRALRSGLESLSRADAVRWDVIEGAHGPAFAAVTDRGLARLSWTHDHDEESFRTGLEERFRDRPVIRDPDALRAVRTELEEYFAGRRSTFDMPVDLSALTEFERRVLGTLRKEVEYGEVIPYGELARRIGRPGSARAVGNALGRNPVAIVVPCHRVIRSDGSLGGYTGGLEFKRRLLDLEGRDDLLKTG